MNTTAKPKSMKGILIILSCLTLPFFTHAQTGKNIVIKSSSNTRHVHLDCETGRPLKMGEWVLSAFEKTNLVAWDGTGCSSFTERDGWHRFTISDSSVKSCSVCGSRPKLKRFFGGGEPCYGAKFQISCSACGGFTTTIGEDLKIIEAAWNKCQKQ